MRKADLAKHLDQFGKFLWTEIGPHIPHIHKGTFNSPLAAFCGQRLQRGPARSHIEFPMWPHADEFAGTDHLKV
jgi:hypothetical protein